MFGRVFFRLARPSDFVSEESVAYLYCCRPAKSYRPDFCTVEGRDLEFRADNVAQFWDIERASGGTCKIFFLVLSLTILSSIVPEVCTCGRGHVAIVMCVTHIVAESKGTLTLPSTATLIDSWPRTDLLTCVLLQLLVLCGRALRSQLWPRFCFCFATVYYQYALPENDVFMKVVLTQRLLRLLVVTVKGTQWRKVNHHHCERTMAAAVVLGEW